MGTYWQLYLRRTLVLHPFYSNKTRILTAETKHTVYIVVILK
jgi:hypothetical protein